MPASGNNRALGFTVQTVLRAAERLKLIDVASVTEGLSFRAADELSHRLWVPWEDAATLYDRLSNQLTEDQLRAVAAYRASRSPFLQSIAAVQSDLRPFLESYVASSARVFPAGEFTCSFTETTFEARLALHRDVRPSLGCQRLSMFALSHAVEAVGHSPLELLRSANTTALMDVSFRLPSPAGEAAATGSFDRLKEIFELIGEPSPEAREADVLALQRGLALTRAEARVARRLVAGLTAKETSLELGITYETVRTHLRNINARLGVSGQRELVELIRRWRATRRVPSR